MAFLRSPCFGTSNALDSLQANVINGKVNQNGNWINLEGCHSFSLCVTVAPTSALDAAFYFVGSNSPNPLATGADHAIMDMRTGFIAQASGWATNALGGISLTAITGTNTVFLGSAIVPAYFRIEYQYGSGGGATVSISANICGVK